MRRNDASSNDSQGRDAGYDPATGAHVVQHDWEDGPSLTQSITNVVTVVKNEESSDIEPLYEAIDPDALESLFRQSSGVTGRVEFHYAGCDVCVESDGTITVTESDA